MKNNKMVKFFILYVAYIIFFILGQITLIQADDRIWDAKTAKIVGKSLALISVERQVYEYKAIGSSEIEGVHAYISPIIAEIGSIALQSNIPSRLVLPLMVSRLGGPPPPDPNFLWKSGRFDFDQTLYRLPELQISPKALTKITRHDVKYEYMGNNTGKINIKYAGGGGTVLNIDFNDRNSVINAMNNLRDISNKFGQLNNQWKLNEDSWNKAISDINYAKGTELRWTIGTVALQKIPSPVQPLLAPAITGINIAKSQFIDKPYWNSMGETGQIGRDLKDTSSLMRLFAGELNSAGKNTGMFEARPSSLFANKWAAPLLNTSIDVMNINSHYNSFLNLAKQNLNDSVRNTSNAQTNMNTINSVMDTVTFKAISSGIKPESLFPLNSFSTYQKPFQFNMPAAFIKDTAIANSFLKGANNPSDYASRMSILNKTGFQVIGSPVTHNQYIFKYNPPASVNPNMNNFNKINIDTRFKNYNFRVK